ncbi:autotransporter domain-containing protein [Rhizobium sp. CSW-27]|uniref:autotransporter domain-containing protein n=1 Tax=Rhizobium sp. CSW-27 TaxID=2839985 RepID=UPI001C021D47|nr:autotransporter domain-containing protein [Rhizobium sp. CSW-27]MBT9371247.1 autotransporter domain-containing protein [Rhizobium sp. CSW-27]
MNSLRSISGERRHRRLMVSTALALLVVQSFSARQAYADTVLWSGGGGTSDWFTDSNWIWDGHSPTAADDARINATGVVVGAPGAVKNLLVGVGGTGSLTLQDDFNSTNVTLGNGAGDSGTLTVSGGSGNVWTNSAAIYVGNAGTGRLDILSGSAVATDDLYLGAAAGGSGTAQLENASTLTANGTIYVGYGGDATNGGTGFLNIYSGSSVTSAAASIADGLNTQGTVAVEGSGSLFDNTGALVVGGGGRGLLAVANGGAVDTGSLSIGSLATASGSEVTVEGNTSSLTVDGDVAVGGSTDAELALTDKASATVGSVKLGITAQGDGTLTVDDASLDVTGRVYVGQEGTGTLDIGNAGTVDAASAVIGWYAGSTGDVTVDGAGSRFDNSAELYVGNEGDGALTVSNGGVVSSTAGYVGTVTGSQGEVTVTGTGSRWDMTDAFIVGYQSGTEGIVTISAGGVIDGLQGSLGDLAGSVGRMTVTGSGSTWSAHLDPNIQYSGDLNVGRHGEGHLSVEDGATVSGRMLHIGNETGSSGEVTVTGMGSSLDITTQLSIGLDGSGTLTLSNGATIVAGRIVIAGGAASTGILTIGTGAGSVTTSTVTFGDGTGKIVFDHGASNYTFAADVEGNGTLQFDSGFTNLTGDYTDFIGNLLIAGGFVSVNTSTLSVVTDVEAGATLGGSGTLGNVNVASGGTVAPGNSIGTLTVADIDFASGSTYSVEIDETGASDLLHATGIATISSGATVHFAPENGTDDGSTYTIGTRYTIITADGGISGQFGSLTDSFAFLDGTLVYDANNVYLTLARNGVSFSSLGITANQRAVGTAFDAMAASGALWGSVATLTDAAVPGAYDQLSGEIHASLRGVIAEDSTFLRDGLLDRLRSGDDGVWLSAFGGWRDGGGDGNGASLRRNTGGFVTGLDSTVTEDWRLGVAAGYSRTSIDVDSRSSKATLDNYSVGIYGSSALGMVDLRFGGSYTVHQISTDRAVDVNGLSNRLTADYDGGTAQAFAEASVSIEAGQAKLSPFAGLAHVRSHTDSFSEAGGDAALSVADDDYAVTYASLGLRAETPVDIGGIAAALHGQLAWRHAFGDDTPDAVNRFRTGEMFSVSGTPIARDVALLGAAVSMPVSDSASLGLAYTAQLGDGDWQNQIKARFDVKF